LGDGFHCIFVAINCRCNFYHENVNRFLYSDSTRGALQVLSRHSGVVDSTNHSLPGGDNGVWINADPIQGCVVVNIGEMWEIWTNGLYRSTLHQVIHKESRYRISIPFFFEPNFDANVAPLAAARRLQNVESNGDTLRSSQGYNPVVYGDFLLKKVGTNFEGGGKY